MRDSKMYYAVGANKNALSLSKYIDEKIIIVDNFKSGQNLMGKIVKKPPRKHTTDNCYVLCLCHEHHTEIIYQLASIGAPIDSIYVFTGKEHPVPLSSGVWNEALSKSSIQDHFLSLCQQFIYCKLSGGDQISVLQRYALFTVDTIDRQLLNLVKENFGNLKKTSFDNLDCPPNYYGTLISDQVAYSKYREAYDFYIPDECSYELANRIVEYFSEEICGAYSRKWKVANIRYLENRLNQRTRGIFQGAWHTDKMPYPVLKVLVFIDGASYEKGTTEVEVDGQITGLTLHKGGMLLFNPNLIKHRAVYNTRASRPSIEITVVPDFSDIGIDFFLGVGTAAQYPLLSCQAE